MTISAYPNDWCVTQASQGGGGGSAFSACLAPVQTDINGQSVDLYSVISKIECWIASHRMVGIKVYFSNSRAGYADDNPSYFFGATGGTYSSFRFDLGETLTALTIYQADYNGKTYCGGLEFATSKGLIYSAKSDNNKNGVAMDIGYGAAVGIFGNSGDAVDRLGFWMILPAETVSLTDVVYDGAPSAPNLTQVDNKPYDNPLDQAESTEYSCPQEVTSTQSWTLANTNSVALSFTAFVSAGVYNIEVSADGTASWAATVQEVYSLEYSMSTNDTFSVTFDIPAQTTVNIEIYRYEGRYELKYTGLGVVKTNNDNIFNYYLSGTTTGNSNTQMYSKLITV
ncbi:hypothetical protein H4S14_003907 [Agrobacterium vitis]|nr:hypothetical protein [Agrobacterium vitis]MBE1440136.1 hypothetical protein [Agrobacterium vitis]